MQSIQDAIQKAGGYAKLAKALGVGQAMIWQWRAGKRPVAAHFCVKIERATGISRRELRPADWGDIWPELIDADHPWPPAAADQPADRAAA